MKSKKYFLAFILVSLAIILSARVEVAGPPDRPRPTVIPSTKNDTSPALRDIPATPQAKPPVFRKIPRQPLPGKGPKDPGFVDPVLQDSTGPINIPSPTSFEGLSNADQASASGSLVLPPDPIIAVGPNHIVQWVNLGFAVYNKSGTMLLGPLAGNSLWSGFGGPCETTNSGDPIVLYDHLADRWFMSQFAIPDIFLGPYFQCIAISQDGDPTGSWYRYEFTISDTKLNDYPKFGVWSDGYYMAVNQFVCDIFCVLGLGFTWGGQGVAVFERDQMLIGGPANMVYFDLFSVDPNLGGMLPSDLDGPPPPAGTPNYYAQVDDSPDQLQIWKFDVDWANPPASTFTHLTDLATAAFDANMCAFSRNCIPQLGGTSVDAISDRLMYRLQYRDFGTHESLVVNHTVDVDTTDHAGIRWYELRNSGGGWSVFQQGTYAPDSDHRWMGSIAMDGDGNIALGYSVSSSSTFPSIRYTGRLAGDPLGTLPGGEGVIIAGGGSQTHSSGRWGDYSLMDVDPTDDCTFWYTQEYYAATSSAGWQTHIGSFKFPSCGGPLVPSISIDDVTVNEGDAGTTDAVFEVTLSGESTETVMVDFSTAGDTATEGSDYMGTSGTLEFAPGVTAQNVTVMVNGDMDVEGDETFFVNLTNPSNATISDSQGLGTILDDDGGICIPTHSKEKGPRCSDGIDNDCDGNTDGADSDCQSSDICTPTEDPEQSCSDGVDNDCDGLVDGSDPDCGASCTPKGVMCTVDAECCSLKCRGRERAKTCK